MASLPSLAQRPPRIASKPTTKVSSPRLTSVLSPPVKPMQSQTDEMEFPSQSSNAMVWPSETIKTHQQDKRDKTPATLSSAVSPLKRLGDENPQPARKKPEPEPKGENSNLLDPLTQEDDDSMLQKLLVDRNIKKKQQLQAIERRKALEQQRMLQQLPNVLPQKPYGPNQQSEISPNHWGGTDRFGNRLNCDPQNPYAPCPNDPPVYSREFDPNPPRKPLSQVFYESKKFFTFDLFWMEPRYRENTAITIVDGLTQQKVPGDFELQLSTRIGFGIETVSGPGLEFFYNEFDQTNVVTRSSSATSVLTTTAFLSPSNGTRTLSTLAANQVLSVQQSTDLQYFDAMFFKFLKFPVAAIVGHIGIRYAEIDHEQHAQLIDGAGATIGLLDHASDFRGFGPRLGITYIRPIGHTRLRMVGSMHGSILAGDREHTYLDSTGFSFVDASSEQIISSLEMRLGVEYAYMLSDSTGFYGKIGFEAHNWFNGGTPINPNSSFGMSGLVFGVGMNR